MLHCTDQSITSQLVKNNKRVLITFVYAKCTYVTRRELWAEFDCWQSHDCPWISIGDFNVIRNDSDRIGGHLIALISMSEFNDCLDCYGLIDSQSIGNNVLV